MREQLFFLNFLQSQLLEPPDGADSAKLKRQCVEGIGLCTHCFKADLSYKLCTSA